MKMAFDSENLDLPLSDATDVANRYISLGDCIVRPFGAKLVPLSCIVDRIETGANNSSIDIIHRPTNKDKFRLTQLDLILTYNKIMNVYENAGWLLFPSTCSLTTGNQNEHHVMLDAMKISDVEHLLNNLDY